MEPRTMRISDESATPPTAAPAFGWWTFGALILYSASLLVFCGVVTMLNYSPVDGSQSKLAAAAPPHLAIAPIKVAGDALTAPRTVCYQLAE
jgi:quinol-cytochrome oxidoreductase complex cytochrome b subunit